MQTNRQKLTAQKHLWQKTVLKTPTLPTRIKAIKLSPLRKALKTRMTQTAKKKAVRMPDMTACDICQ